MKRYTARFVSSYIHLSYYCSFTICNPTLMIQQYTFYDNRYQFRVACILLLDDHKLTTRTQKHNFFQLLFIIFFLCAFAS